jgi:hypothetical protein
VTPDTAPIKCIGNDPTCPCLDGEACHYKDAADGTKGWPAPAAPMGQEAQALYDAMDSCEWSVRRMLPCSYLTDEANAERQWAVERTRAPFCGDDGVRIWTGPTVTSALAKARAAIAPTPPMMRADGGEDIPL